MENIKPGDLCVVKSGGEKICFIVDEATPNFVSGTRLNLLQFRDDLQDYKYPDADSWAPYVKPKTVSALREQLKLCDAPLVSDSLMRQFARYEIPLERLNPNKAPFEIAVPFDFALTIDDLLEALRKIRDERDKAKLRSWALGFYQFLLPSVRRVFDLGGQVYFVVKNEEPDSIPRIETLLIGDDSETEGDDDEEEEDYGYVGVGEDSLCFPTEESVLHDVCTELYDLLQASKLLCAAEDFKKDDPCIGNPKYRAILGSLVEELEICVENRDLPIVKRHYERDDKKRFVETFWLFYETADPEWYHMRTQEDERELFVRFVDELSAEGDTTAMEIKARGCYEENYFYDQDFFKARDLLTELAKNTDVKTDLLVLLGNIYYEGECNDGLPEYEKAYYFYSIAALDGDIKARIRLADMFCKGDYVPRKQNVFWKMIWILYQENFEDLFKKRFKDEDSDLYEDYAEIALRVGDAYRYGIGVEKSWENALYYYLQANFVNEEFIGWGRENSFRDVELIIGPDPSSDLSIRIKESIDAMEKMAPIGYFQENFCKTDCVTPFIKHALFKDARFEACAKKLNGEKFLLKLNWTVTKHELLRSVLLTIPQAKYCDFAFDIILTVEPVVSDLDFTGDYASFSFDKYDENTGVFYLDGKNVAIISGDFTWSPNVSFENKKRKYVAVKFKSGFKTYDYLCDIDGIKVGVKVLAPTSHGNEVVEVQKVFERLDSDSPLPIGSYKKIVRKVDK